MALIGHFPEGEQMTAMLSQAREQGLDFDTAWKRAMLRLRRGRQDDNPRWQDLAVGFEYAREAFERAYLHLPPVRQDSVARSLLDAMTHMLDWSEDAVATDYTDLMAA